MQNGSKLLWGLIAVGFLVVIAIVAFTYPLNDSRPLVNRTNRNEPRQQDDGTTIPLDIVEAPNNAVIALVPVLVNGEGPYPFALDTGASRSVIDETIVEQLDIEVIGPAGPATGVGGEVQASQIRIDNWQIGDVSIPTEHVVTLDLLNEDSGMAGLLGSDVLSDFNAVTVDYENSELHLLLRPERTSLFFELVNKITETSPANL